MLKCFMSAQAYLTGQLNRDDKGATAVEYGLLVALIAAVIIGIVLVLGQHLSTIFNNVNSSMSAG